jgi:general secretion pathway protein D
MQPGRMVRNSDRRRAAKLYLASSKLFVDEHFEEAMRGYEQAAALDPESTDYRLAAEVARSHAVTALIQAAAKDRLHGDAAGARATLGHALELEPKNIQVIQHLYELGDDALLGQSRTTYEQAASTVGAAVELEPTAGVHSFHLRSDARQIIPQVFKAYGIDATVDSTVLTTHLRLDVDDVDFETAARVVGLATASFYVPLDAHHVLAARDTKENRQQFTPMEFETVYLPALNATELTDVVNLAKNVFSAQQVVSEPGSGTITIRASHSAINAFNATMSDLLDGRNQVMLEVRLIQLAHTNMRNTGVRPPQGISAYNIYAEEQSILNANQSLVQQIISSGLAAPRRHQDDSGHSAGFRADIEFPVCQRPCPVWRRSDGIRAGSGRDHAQPEPELLGLARVGRDAVAAGRRRGRHHQVRHEISHSDFFILQPGIQHRLHRRADRRRNLQQPLLAAGFPTAAAYRMYRRWNTRTWA